MRLLLLVSLAGPLALSAVASSNSSSSNTIFYGTNRFLGSVGYSEGAVTSLAAGNNVIQVPTNAFVALSGPGAARHAARLRARLPSFAWGSACSRARCSASSNR